MHHSLMGDLWPPSSIVGFKSEDPLWLINTLSLNEQSLNALIKKINWLQIFYSLNHKFSVMTKHVWLLGRAAQNGDQGTITEMSIIQEMLSKRKARK